MSGFIFTFSSNNKWWYLIGAIFFLVGGIALAIAGFLKLGIVTGIVGIVIALASVIFLIDAIKNL